MPGGQLSLEHIVKANPTAIVTGFYALAGGKQVRGRDNSVQQTSDKDLIIDPHTKIQLKNHTSETLAREKSQS